MLADGRRVQRDVGEALVAVNGDSVPCRVVFGESEDAVLLGLTALEQPLGDLILCSSAGSDASWEARQRDVPV